MTGVLKPKTVPSLFVLLSAGRSFDIEDEIVIFMEIFVFNSRGLY